ncbi:hypothetical protein BLA29_005442 [Euroglyphus maynei]|uniref:Uncharacterized protein n=1 Tax=Euroglyphus maynei TaxID=6958 RepID=A0A1Y3B781_EURMA|nr:hypothetical protein BLA29_005442 [Euroglyphus maynei]
MTLEEEQRLSSSSSQTSTPSNTINVEQIRNQHEESDHSDIDEQSQNQSELKTTEKTISNDQPESDQQEDSKIEQLQHYISQIRFDSNTGRHQIPAELLAEDQDLLESEFETLDNDIDVIEMYRIIFHHPTLQQPKPIRIMDDQNRVRLIDRLRNDSRLKPLLNNPKIQMFIKEILDDEHKFLHQQLSSHWKNSHSGNNQRPSTLFEDQRFEQQISPLEQHLIDGQGSDEQNFLRLLIEIIQQPY